MEPNPFVIEFEYPMENLTIRLTAEVEMSADRTGYIVKKFRSLASGQLTSLPDVRLIKTAESWVHSDSRKGSLLTDAIGLAIDRHVR